MEEPEQLARGELNAAVTSALVGIHHKYLGRGPKTASTFHYGNVLVTMMHEVLTHAEKSLTQTGQIDAVNNIRHLFQETMAADFREAVERITGRKVLVFISGDHVDPTSRPSCSSSTDPRAGRTPTRDRQSASIGRGLNRG
jgi:uncharacterized protein YbcI